MVAQPAADGTRYGMRQGSTGKETALRQGSLAWTGSEKGLKWSKTDPANEAVWKFLGGNLTAIIFYMVTILIIIFTIDIKLKGKTMEVIILKVDKELAKETEVARKISDFIGKGVEHSDIWLRKTQRAFKKTNLRTSTILKSSPAATG